MQATKTYIRLNIKKALENRLGGIYEDSTRRMNAVEECMYQKGISDSLEMLEEVLDCGLPIINKRSIETYEPE